MVLTTTPIDVHAAAWARGSLWVAVDAADAPLGFLLAEPVEKWLHLLELDVHPGAQGRGLGAALIDAAAAAAPGFGCDRLSLTTFIDIPWNAPWYRRLGFGEIAAADQPDWLAGILVSETETGLDPANRCAMIRLLV
jgi:GNAT superfamily N-acetyltransferase